MRWNNVFKSHQSKILDFLLDHPSYDYSITEISDRANVSRPTLYKILPEMVKNKVLYNREKRYGLNLKNKAIQIMIKIDMKKKIPYAHDHKHFCPCCTIIGPGNDFYGRDRIVRENLEKDMKKFLKTKEGKKLQKEGKEFTKKFMKELEKQNIN